MFPFPIAKQQGCDIQTFYGVGASSNATLMSWNKPVGVNHIYIMCIGAGGNGNGTNGGGSGAVTVWYGAAQHVPNNLVIQPALDQSLATRVFYNNGQNYTLLVANSANNSSAGAGSTSPTSFGSSGFFRSIDGQDGTPISINSSDTTFLSGGAQGTGDNVTANYGYYSFEPSAKSYFLMQPIIVGVGASGSSNGSIGCGGGGTGTGGPGLVLIASW